MKLQFTSVITKEGRWYVAHCVETGVASQGRTTASAKKNLREAMELYLDDLSDSDLLKLRRQKSLIVPLAFDYA